MEGKLSRTGVELSAEAQQLFEAESERDSYTHVEVGQIRRARVMRIASCPRREKRARFARASRRWERYGGEREKGENLTGWVPGAVWCAGLHQTGITHTSASASWLANLPLLRLHPEILLVRSRGNVARVIASIQACRRRRQIADLANFGPRWRETRSLFLSLSLYFLLLSKIMPVCNQD